MTSHQSRVLQPISGSGSRRRAHIPLTRTAVGRIPNLFALAPSGEQAYYDFLLPTLASGSAAPN